MHSQAAAAPPHTPSLVNNSLPLTILSFGEAVHDSDAPTRRSHIVSE